MSDNWMDKMIYKKELLQHSKSIPDLQSTINLEHNLVAGMYHHSVKAAIVLHLIHPNVKDIIKDSIQPTIRESNRFILIVKHQWLNLLKGNELNLVSDNSLITFKKSFLSNKF